MEASRLSEAVSARLCKLICNISTATHTSGKADGLSVGIVHVGIALFDELLGELQDLVEMIRTVHDLVVGNFDHAQILLDTLLEQLLSRQLYIPGQAQMLRTSSFNGLVSSNRKMN